MAGPQDAPNSAAVITEPTADNRSADELADSQAESEAVPAEAPAADVNTAIPRPSLPEPAKIQKQIDDLEKDDSIPEEEKAELRTALQATLDSLVAVVEAQREAEQYEAAAEAFKEIPAKTQQVKKTLEELSNAPAEVPISNDLPIEELRARKTQAEADWAAARKTEAALVAMEVERSKLKANLSKRIADERTKIQALQEKTPLEDADETSALRVAEATKNAAEIFLAEQKIESLLQQRRIAEAEEELLPLQIKLAKQQLARHQAVAQRYAEAINARETVQLENALESYRQELANADVDPASSIIDRYDEDWMQIVRDQTRITRESARVIQQRKLYEERQEASNAEIEKADESGRGVGSGLGLKLQRELSKLPTPHDLNAEITKVDAQIEWARSFQADVENSLDVLEGDSIGLDSAAARGHLRPLTDSGQAPAWTREEFRQQELEMLRKLNSDVDRYVTDLIALRELHETLRDTVTDYRELINRHVMWIRSDRRYSQSDLSLAWSSFQWMVHPQNLSRFGESLWSELFRRPDGLILWMLALIGWALGGSHLRRRIKVYRDQAIRGNQVSMQPTLWTLVATVALAALPSLFVAIPGWRIYKIPLASNYVEAIGLGLLTSSALLFPMELIRQLIRPYGLGVAHYGWKESTVQPLRAAIRCTTELMLIFAFFWMLAAKSDIVAIASSLGRPLFTALMATISFALWRALHPRTGIPADSLRRNAGGWLDRLRYVWHPVIAAFPLGLGIVSLLGYRYSAEQLTTLLYETLWLGIGLYVLSGLLHRWVLLSRRRLLLQQIRERAEAAEKQAEGEHEEMLPIIDPESETIDITNVNAQTLRLIHAFVATLAIIGLFWTWSVVLPALNYLESRAALWDSDGNTVLTMANVLLPIPIIILTIIAWRNVPGLLETALLQRLPLDNATRYAITTLSSYGLFMIGIALSATQFGLKWDSIQWLVAALGVGLGFGLQEIFANFISGIILLFEQPLRVGDVVTLGDTTGVVSRIRIRATTITTWERQELIIPNKDLITGRLINWTLSDSMNRVLLNIGVAYGSDTRKACAILEDICLKHENVAEDPPPIVTFEGFGDSTLNIVVRCFLNSMAVRLATIHELHTEVNDRFRAEGIEIAFPQRDLNIRSVPDELAGVFTQRTPEAIP